jgi:hypothetical protein
MHCTLIVVFSHRVLIRGLFIRADFEEADYMYLVTLLGRIIYFQGGNVYYEF